MKKTLMHVLIVLIVAIAVFIGITKLHIEQVRRKQWAESRDIIVVTVHYGAGIDQYGYTYKPDWMPIQEYREQILELNGMENSTLYAGQELKLYTEGNTNV